MRFTFFSILGILFLLQLSCDSKKEVEYDLVIASAIIIDSYSGKLISNQSIAILRDSIADIVNADSAKIFKAKKVVDASGKYVIPGLWDMHVHFGGRGYVNLENKNLLPLFIANGVTSVRDCSADISPSVFKWKSEIERAPSWAPLYFPQVLK